MTLLDLFGKTAMLYMYETMNCIEIRDGGSLKRSLTYPDTKNRMAKKSYIDKKCFMPVCGYIANEMQFPAHKMKNIQDGNVQDDA